MLASLSTRAILKAYLVACSFALLAVTSLALVVALVTGVGWFSGGTFIFISVLIAAPIIPVAVLVLGIPVWIAVHAWGARRASTGLILGAVLGAVACAALAWAYFGGPPDPLPHSNTWIQGRQTVAGGQLTAHGAALDRRSDLIGLGVATVIGAVAGMAAGLGIWISAYRNAGDEPTP